MGKYLDLANSNKPSATTSPNENYSREVMQLFMIGLYQLNPDGSRKVDGQGQPVPAYDQSTIQEVSLAGGDVYGRFPNLALGGPDDSGSRGALIPTTLIDQYGAAMARWFGVADTQMGQVFPSLSNFPVPSLGFLG